jgi:hypothetical protein
MFGPVWPVVGRAALCGVFVTAMLLAGSADPLKLAAAQNAAPRIPDFQIGADLAWHELGDDFLPPPSGPGPITNDPKHPFSFEQNYRVADTTNPILQPWAAEQMRKSNAAVLAGGVGFRPRERCLPAGVPGFVIYARVEPFYFLQGPKEVTILNSGGPEIRHVFLNVPHSEHVKPSWYGESVGHYEGRDTLVVDTIGLSTKSFVDNYRTPHSEKLHVVERFKMSADRLTMEDFITVDDPGAFTRPWSAIQRFELEEYPLKESVCAENNENFFHYDVAPMPVADKPDF